MGTWVKLKEKVMMKPARRTLMVLVVPMTRVSHDSFLSSAVPLDSVMDEPECPF